MKNTISVTEIFKRGWRETKKHITFLGVSTLIYLALYLVLSGVGKGFFGGILGIAASIISVIFSLGIIRIALLIESGGTPKKEDFSVTTGLFFTFLWASIIVGFFVIVGLFLLIIPGIFVAIRLCFTNYLIVDKKLGAWTAVKQSWRMTSGFEWVIVQFFVIALLIGIVSIIPVGLGLILSVPFLALSQAILYRKIHGDAVSFSNDVTSNTPSTLVAPPPITTEVAPEHTEEITTVFSKEETVPSPEESKIL